MFIFLLLWSLAAIAQIPQSSRGFVLMLMLYGAPLEHRRDQFASAGLRALGHEQVIFNPGFRLYTFETVLFRVQGEN